MSPIRSPFLQTTLALTVLAVPASAGDFYKQYTPVDDPRAQKFVEDGLALAVELLGKPHVAVKKVHLRLSRPLDPRSDLKRAFQMCELLDSRAGVFCIYLGREPGDYAFHGQLAHEIGHLLNARLLDAYAEGLASVFAEKLLAKLKLDWTGWRRHYESGAEPFYGTTYFMMRDVWDAAGDRHIRTLLGHAVFVDKEKTRMRLNVEAWLKTLPDDVRKKVRAVILDHAPKVRKAIGVRTETFAIPR
jgi:hypothetical protein